MKGVIRHVGWCVHYFSESDILKCLNFQNIRLFSISPELESVCPNGFKKCFVDQNFGFNEGIVIAY